MTYPDAPRHIPATAELRLGWSGPLAYVADYFLVCSATCINGHVYHNERHQIDPVLDPLRPEVRDHIIRRLSLPQWVRDGAGLDPWQSAGLIACAAAGGHVAALLGTWVRWGSAGMPAGFERHDRPLVAGNGPSAHWYAGRKKWPYGGGAPRTADAADAAALALADALMASAEEMWLPWPGGPRVWRRT